jgi:hypothetical protein
MMSGPDNLLDPAAARAALDNPATGPAELVDKLEIATGAAAAAIDPDQIGLVAVEEDGSWFVSASATVGDIQYQAVAALAEGLKAAQNR